MSKRKVPHSGMAPRAHINSIRAQVAEDIATNAMKYKRALLREVDALWRQTASARGGSPLRSEALDERLEELIDKVSAQFKIKPAAQKILTDEVRAAQAEIKEVWGDYFESAKGGSPLRSDAVITLKPGEYEKMRSLYKVDFKGLQEEQREIITEEVRRAVGAGKGFTDLRDALSKRGMGAAHAETLANTSLAQFDNAVMHEYAAQAGIEKFRYDGPLNANTRQFCRERIGKIFTLDEIMKMDNGQGLDVMTSCGGYNCVHAWTPIIN